MTGALLFISLHVLAFQWQSCLALPTEPTHNRGHRHPKSHHKAKRLSDKDEVASDKLRDSEVTLTAGGSFHSGHSMMRRQSDSAKGEKHHHDRHHTKALFQALDLNGDGKITQGEIKHVSELFAETPDEVRKRGQHVANMVVEDIDEDGDGAIDFNEFVSSMHQSLLPSPNAHKVHRHQFEEGFTEAALNEQGWGTHVSCGGHNADSCENCPSSHDDYDAETSHGEDFCNGDCRWCSSGSTAGVCINDETEICPTDGNASSDQAPKNLPKKSDLLDKNFTDLDREISDKAAESAIHEESIEEERKAEEAEEKKFTKRKFWLIIVITFSVILGLCAIISIITLVVFYFMGVSEEPKLVEEGEDDGEQGEEDGGEEEPVEEEKEEEEDEEEEEKKPKNRKEKLATNWMSGVSNIGSNLGFR